MNNMHYSDNGGQLPLKCENFPALHEKAAEPLSVTQTCDNITVHSDIHSGSEIKQFKNSQWKMIPIWIKCRR